MSTHTRSQLRHSSSSPQAAIAPLKAVKAAHCRGLTAWRGLSGRRYVVSVYDPSHVPDYGDAVLIAVAKARAGGRRILAIGTGPAAPFAALAGCSEIHVHLLARGAAEKARLLADLALPALRKLSRGGALLPAA